jgi:Tfp pilus assembly protein PilF
MAPVGSRLSWICLLPAVLAVIVYFGMRDAPFLYDDHRYVESNPLIHGVQNVPRIWLSPSPPDSSLVGWYRPITTSSFLIDQAVSGLRPGTFHCGNVFLHAAAAAVFTWLLLLLGSTRVAASMAGALWAVHPVLTESVCWVVGRAEILSFLGCLAGIIAWIQFRRTGRARFLGSAAVCYYLALNAKESAAPLPAVLLLGDLVGAFKGGATMGLIAGPSIPSGFRGRSVMRYAKDYSWLIAMFVIYLMLRMHALGGLRGTSYLRAFQGGDDAARLMTAAAFYFRAVSMMFWPRNLRVDYDGFEVRSAADPRFIGGILLLAVSGLIAWRCARTRFWLTFWIGWIGLFLLTTSNLIVETGAVFAERFLYTPTAGVCALAGMGVVELAAKRNSLRVIAGLLTVAVLGIFVAQTIQRETVWRSEELFWRTAVRQSPHSAKMLANLAAYLSKVGKARGDASKVDQAIQFYRQGLAVMPTGMLSSDSVQMMNDLGTIFWERQQYAEAIPLFEKVNATLAKYPEMPVVKRDQVVMMLAYALMQSGQLPRADELLSEIVAMRSPESPGALMNQGYIRVAQGRLDEGIEKYRRAVELAPSLSVAQAALANALELKKKQSEKARAGGGNNK